MGLELCNTLQFQFRRRYNLPPTDLRFLDATIEEMLIDGWAWAHAENPQLRESDETDGFDEVAALLEAGADLEEVISATYDGGT